MKVCIIKQYYDVLGPTTSFNYRDLKFQDLLKLHNTKTNGLESFLLFEADHYILDSYNFARHECDIIEANTLEDNYTNTYHATLGTVKSEQEIPFENYDVVWCRDPILKNIQSHKVKYPTTLFVYEEVEHSRGFCPTNSRFYDLILRHDHPPRDILLQELNKEIPFPYPRSPAKMRKQFSCDKKIQLYIDYRDLMHYALGAELSASSPSYSSDKIKVVAKLNHIQADRNIKKVCNLKNSLNGLCVSPSGESDSFQYLSLLAESKYFSSTSGRLGQSLVDAAGLNCICFGTTRSPNHNLLCHPFTLFSSFQPYSEVEERILKLESNPQLQEEILLYQNQRLQTYFVEYQQNILSTALQLKRNP
tara:strand:- start:145 stop:1230 length:1086 start_codon:yes stop_codon:yes gene_type:complete